MGVHDGHREKLRRRFREAGAEHFADHELVELLLFYAIPRRDTTETAHRLMERYGSLDAVLKAPVEDLVQVEGVGESAALLLRLAPELCRRASVSREKEIILNSTDRAGEYLLGLFGSAGTETVYQLCLDRKGKLLSCRRLSEGSASSAEVNIRKLVENALMTAASAVILAHNHPSGIALPSREDYSVTEQAHQALATIGVRLVDHIIVADGDFVSMADSGLLTR